MKQLAAHTITHLNAVIPHSGGDGVELEVNASTPHTHTLRHIAGIFHSSQHLQANDPA